MKVVDVFKGTIPIVLGQPHGGTSVPDDIFARLNQRGQGLDDTDWHITRLYDGLLDGASVVKSNVHRYVIDANRDPAGKSLYPGQNTTELCPTTNFDSFDIWQNGQSPSPDEVENRRLAYHAPYHAALAEEVERVRLVNGIAILYDCHSIRSDIPFLFDGILPVFNIGTNNGITCISEIEAMVHANCLESDPSNTVLNGRFKGGWTTRHYGQPDNGIHAIQMELAQRSYMSEAHPRSYDEDRAKILQSKLKRILMGFAQYASA
jgi:formiminoglutamase